MVEPTNPEETVEILNNIKDRYEDHHNVFYTQDAIESCVNLTLRYISDRHLPDKAIDALDVHELAWEKISSTFDQERRDKIARFMEKQGTGKTAIGIVEILPKAFEGKIDTLFCENPEDIFGTYKIENDTIKATESEENDTAISLMNLAAIKTFLNGGTVYLLDKEDMPNTNSKINALYRY